MARIISASIDLSKIDKSKIVEKNGAKYYDFDITVNDEPNKFGQDVSITQKQSKEEREAKEKKVFIGNGKTVWKKEPQADTNYTSPAQNNSSAPVEDDSLPF